jgi:FkbM family methyltransferase
MKEFPMNFNYIDIGASGGIDPKWNCHIDYKNSNLILVEPDLLESEKLRTLYPLAQIIPFALGSENKKASLHVTAFQKCSSVLEPNFEILKRFPVKKLFKVLRQIEIDLFPFTYFAETLNIENVDFVKIDVQGFEQEVLEGFGNILNKVLCIKLETHLLPIYKTQKTLTYINEFLQEKGFYLRHLESVGAFEGEVVEFDAYFIKKPELISSEIERNKIDFWVSVEDLPKAFFFSECEHLLEIKE